MSAAEAQARPRRGIVTTLLVPDALILIALLIAGAEALRKQRIREFPGPARSANPRVSATGAALGH